MARRIEKSIVWDVRREDPIDYFDPELSYEITGYRPITKTKGLDFNPSWFTSASAHKIETGKYSLYVKDSKGYVEFWQQEIDRCENGVTINGYRITGDNYFWLNYYRLKQSKEGGKQAGGRAVAFPTFYVFQYEYFHYIELCEMLGKDVGVIKSRGIGFSEIAASLAVRPFITTPNYRTVATAFSEGKLTPLKTKMWSQLDWLNNETEMGMYRSRMVLNKDSHKRASKKQSDGTETGRMAEIELIVADLPDKVRGDRCDRLFYEEAGSNKYLIKAWVQGEALVTVMGGDKIGTRIAFGTGGDVGESIKGIRKLSFNPTDYNILPYKHYYTETGEEQFSSFFIPAHRIVTDRRAGLIDTRGWCDDAKAKEWYNKKRAGFSNEEDLQTYKAEYCFTISEALSQEGDNIFPKAELANQQMEIEVFKTVPKPEMGDITWNRPTTHESPERNAMYPTGVIWRANRAGKVLIVEHPIRVDGSSEGYRNLYVGGIDSIDIGTKDSASDKGASEFCIMIKRRQFGLSEPKYVAMYKDRPRDIREAYEIAAALLTYYGCQAVLESTRTAIITYFRDKKYINLLMKRPRSTLADVTKTNSNMLGAPATVKVINHYRELIYDYVIDYAHNINFIQVIDQLLRYSDANKKEFDIVAAMGMCELGDEELSNKRPTPIETPKRKMRDIGYYIDEKGYKRYGIIPDKNEEDWYARSRNPRVNDSWIYNELV